ncbi:Nucleoporin GLE1 [Orchesella cincta]|uniref:mRNA export factor GLE1 n=1 Tax=Orchesella cincta TaxID=48709 RepID=A0A1D2NM60_ORCCI|nr:Nucleoporin GLE1 [Orchesella cincta]
MSKTDSGIFFVETVHALENSPKGRLSYENGWDTQPYAVTKLIATVQESEIDGPNRAIVERCVRVHNFKERLSLSPKTSPDNKSCKGRHSLPLNDTKSLKESTAVSPLLLSSFSSLRVADKARQGRRPPITAVRNTAISALQEPRIQVQVVPDIRTQEVVGHRNLQEAYQDCTRRRLLTPPSPIRRRKKSVDGSPNLKPSPTLSSSTQTQTHSSTTTDATATPTWNPRCGKPKKFGISDLNQDEDKLEEDLFFESKISPFDFITECQNRFEKGSERKAKEALSEKVRQFKEAERQSEKLAEQKLRESFEANQRVEEVIRESWAQKDRKDLEFIQQQQKNRLKEQQQQLQERKAKLVQADQARANRQAAEEAVRQQQILKQQQENEAEQKRKEQDAILENNRRQQEQKAREEQAAQNAAEQKRVDQQQRTQIVPELEGLILKDDLTKYARTTELLKRYEEPTAHINGKEPATKAFYVGAAKSINTPLNALADTHADDILMKVQHFSKLLSGEQVSGGGSMSTLFSSKATPNGELFVMKTLAFRFVKKSEADVTRGKSTVQPLAAVGTYLCKQFPAWADLVQANMYKLCPFLVPFSYPQGNKPIQEYAKELGHDLSGAETAIQQTFLERIKGYCTLYALMVLKFHGDGPFDVGDATEFFSLGGAWQILSRTMKLEPQVDVTATVIHTILEILDDKLSVVYRTQFNKLMRLLILNYLPKIKNITPPAKSGSLSRLQIYLEKKFSL